MTIADYLSASFILLRSNRDSPILGNLKALMPADSHTVESRCTTIIKIYLNERNTVAEIGYFMRYLNLNVVLSSTGYFLLTTIL